MEELLSLVLPPKQSLDQDLDPCKSPAFLGDIVYPEANLTIRKVVIMMKMIMMMRPSLEIFLWKVSPLHYGNILEFDSPV